MISKYILVILYPTYYVSNQIIVNKTSSLISCGCEYFCDNIFVYSIKVIIVCQNEINFVLSQLL